MLISLALTFININHSPTIIQPLNGLSQFQQITNVYKPKRRLLAQPFQTPLVTQTPVISTPEQNLTPLKVAQKSFSFKQNSSSLFVTHESLFSSPVGRPQNIFTFFKIKSSHPTTLILFSFFFRERTLVPSRVTLRTPDILNDITFHFQKFRLSRHFSSKMT